MKKTADQNCLNLLRSVTKIVIHNRFRSVARHLGTGAALAFPIAAAMLVPGTALAQEASDDAAAAEDLFEMDLDALVNMEVTSVSKKAQKITDAPAAISVLTNDRIKESGARNIPEALRLVPGIHVGQINAHSWAISSRGFNGQFANKLLVMIDGRSVYTPLFAGTYWDAQNVFLEDVDRIEVIRGPGATVWGANAVNGVINIVTKSAKDTQGSLVYGGGGTEKRAFGGARFGDMLGESTAVRVYAKYDLYDSSELPNGQDAMDEWDNFQGGFRLDYDKNDTTAMTVSGDGYYGNIDDDTGEIAGGNLLGRWSRTLNERSSVEAFAYWDNTYRSDDLIEQKRDTFNVEGEHTFGLGERNDIIWGLGYRHSIFRSESNDPNIAILDDNLSTDLFSGFIQDDLQIIEDQLTLTLGTKIEHNDFTGWELQPSGRITYKPAENQTVWGSISRAVRTPSEVEGKQLFALPIGFQPPNIVPTLFGNTNLDSEELLAYELGYRIQPYTGLSFDLALFYNEYKKLTGTGPSGPDFPQGPIVVDPQSFFNSAEGETYGGELAANYAISQDLNVGANYSLLLMHLHATQPGGSEGAEDQSPVHMASIFSTWDVTDDWQVSGQIRYVDAIRAYNIPSYVEGDLRIAWMPRPDLEVSVVGQNLFDSSHPEYVPGLTGANTEVERGVYGKISYSF